MKPEDRASNVPTNHPTIFKPQPPSPEIARPPPTNARSPTQQPWSLRLQAHCQTTKRPSHRRRSTAEEADSDRRGRPLAGPEPTANPVSQMPRLRPGHWPSHHTGAVCREVDGGRPGAHVGGLPCSLRMDDDLPPTGDST
jgi:hypothetical protein